MKESIVDERRVRDSEAPRAERPSGARRGAQRLYLVGGGRGQESPDVRITEENRQLVRHVVAELESALPAEVLMFLSGAVEAAARRKRALEDSA